MRNSFFGVFILLMMMLAVVCAFIIDTQARAPDAEVVSQREEETCAILTEISNQIDATAGRFAVLLNFTGTYYVLYEDVEVTSTTNGAYTAKYQAEKFSFPWTGGGSGGDQDSRYEPALA